MTIPHAHSDSPAVAGLGFGLRYEQSAMLRTSQFVLAAEEDQLVLECSSGLVEDTAGLVLPIHTRLSLSRPAAERLQSLLSQMLTREQNISAAEAQAVVSVPTAPRTNVVRRSAAANELSHV